MKKNQRRLLHYLLLAVFLISTAFMLFQYFDNNEAEDSYSAAEELAKGPETEPQIEVIQPDETEPLPTEPAEILWVPAPVEEDDPYLEELSSTDLAALREVNPDVIGWITIPDSKIHYPLMQGEDNEYYLEHTWDNIPSASGSIFLECRNSADLTDFNTIVYGHNMRSGTMFASLHYFSYPDYFSARPYVYLVTDDGVLRYEIFSTYRAEVDSQTYGLSFHQQETRENFIANALERSEIDTGIIPGITDRILTLSTCSGWGYETRWVVHARLKMVVQE